MLHKLNLNYLVVGSLLFLILIVWVDPPFLPIYLLNIFTFASFFFVLNYSLKLKSYSYTNLALIVLIYSVFFVALYNAVSFYYKGNFYVFSEIDALNYHYFSTRMAAMPLGDSINYYLNHYAISDLGMVLILSSLYRLVESNLFFNIFNIITGVVTSLGIYRISRHLMMKKYAFICALSFSLSSYFIWFHASGIKESFMVLLVVFFFDQFYMFTQKNKRKNIIFAGLIALTLILFRPALMFFCIGSVVIGLLFSRKLTFKTLIGLIGAVILFVITFSFFEMAIQRFLMGGSYEQIIAAKRATGMVIGSLPFTYSVNILAQLIGPLPSLLPSFSPRLTLYSAGLIYRVLLSFAFWVAVYYIFKMRENKMYPLIFFALMEMASLVLILEGLELRKALPHLPIVYISAFWFFGNYKNKLLKRRLFIQRLFIIFSIVIIFILLFWNIGRI